MDHCLSQLVWHVHVVFVRSAFRVTLSIKYIVVSSCFFKIVSWAVMDFMDFISMHCHFGVCIYSLSTISLRNLELSPSIILFTSCLVNPFEVALSKASTVFASVVFAYENPSLVNSSCDGAFIPSRLLEGRVNSTYFPQSLMFYELFVHCRI